MTAVAEITITCDGSNIGYFAPSEVRDLGGCHWWIDTEETKVRAARGRAELSGWKTVRKDRRLYDICPNHQPMRPGPGL